MANIPKERRRAIASRYYHNRKTRQQTQQAGNGFEPKPLIRHDTTEFDLDELLLKSNEFNELKTQCDKLKTRQDKRHENYILNTDQICEFIAYLQCQIMSLQNYKNKNKEEITAINEKLCKLKRQIKGM